LFPQYEARKGDPQTYPEGDLMQLISVKNIAFTFPFVPLIKKPVLASLIHRIS
jgi:hypothetical protein